VRWSGSISVLASYLALFGVLAWPWITSAHEAIPRAGSDFDPDNILIVWILAWVAHALGTAPASLFSPPINYPAPLQLAGSEHFASSQLVFGPIFWLTGNAVLGANLAALLSYPLGAWVMQRLLIAVGCAGGAAWVAGLLFALGPLRVPASIHTLQYVNLFLPLVALALVRLRERPTAWRTGLLGGALLLGLFSSYYTAVMVLGVAVPWAAWEWGRPGPDRRRFAVLAAIATAASVLLLALASRPYFAQARLLQPMTQDALRRLEEILGGVQASSLRRFYLRRLLEISLPGFSDDPWSHAFWSPVALVLTALGVVAAFGSRAPAVRGVAALGGLFAVAGAVLMPGPDIPVGTHTVPLPFSLLAVSPIRFFRAAQRFAVVAGFGTALLGGMGLQLLEERLRAVSLRRLLVLAAGAATLVTGGLALCDNSRLFIRAAGPDAHVYQLVGRIARQPLHGGEAPLVELPASDYGLLRSGAERRVGATWHWLPSVCDYSGYPSEHMMLVLKVLERLPDPEAVAELVDMTHVRWLLLRPARDWGGEPRRQGFLDALRANHAVVRHWNVEDWMMLRLARIPRRPEWFAAIAAGPREGRSLLGTPLAPLSSSAAVGALEVESPPAEVRPGAMPSIRLVVRNLGDAAWPVAVAPSGPQTHTVGIAARWVPRDAPDANPEPQTLALRRDLPAEQTMRDEIRPVAPARAGRYDLELRLVQGDGPTFPDPPGGPVRLPIEVRAVDP